MKTLHEMIAALPIDRQARIEARTQQLRDQVRHLHPEQAAPSHLTSPHLTPSHLKSKADSN